MNEEHEAALKYLKSIGERQTRLLFASGHLPSNCIQAAAYWLAQLDDAERTRSDASSAEQAEIARSANRAAWIAAKAAIIAAAIAIASIVVTILAWFFPRH